jgi:hypothetical protein
MSSEEVRSARSFTALSRYCPIPVVIEPQSIHAFRSEPFLAEKAYFLGMALIAASMSIVLSSMSLSCHLRHLHFILR